MSGPDRDCFPRADELARAATPLERELAALEPAPPSPGLRERIAAELAAAAPGADLQSGGKTSAAGSPPARPGQPVRGVLERLAWAAGGALAATVVLGLPVGGPERPAAPAPVVEAEPAAVVAADQPAEPPAAPARPLLPARPLVSEEPSRWADEGVRFLDDTTPARVLRRMVVERHRAPSGQAEVRVPRADVILLPVAFQ